MRYLTTLLCLLVLASCGADGEPVRPTGSATVSVGSDGLETSATVSATQGPLTISVGF
ncbi:MAG: hypothetical protein AAF618_12765 [Pseudomonadota bacterium]